MQLLRLSGILQLAGPEAMRDMQEAIAAHEGCELHGKLPVPRVAGNFHLSVHAQSFYVLRQVRSFPARKPLSTPLMRARTDERRRTPAEHQPQHPQA